MVQGLLEHEEIRLMRGSTIVTTRDYFIIKGKLPEDVVGMASSDSNGIRERTQAPVQVKSISAG